MDGGAEEGGWGWGEVLCGCAKASVHHRASHPPLHLGAVSVGSLFRRGCSALPGVLGQRVRDAGRLFSRVGAVRRVESPWPCRLEGEGVLGCVLTVSIHCLSLRMILHRETE